MTTKQIRYIFMLNKLLAEIARDVENDEIQKKAIKAQLALGNLLNTFYRDRGYK